MQSLVYTYADTADVPITLLYFAFTGQLVCTLELAPCRGLLETLKHQAVDICPSR
jgi:hypothetical protein